MKRQQLLIIGGLISSILLAGCTSPPTPDLDTSSQDSNTPTPRVLSNELTEGFYQTIVPFVSSPIRGLRDPSKSLDVRFDIEEIERSLKRASTSFFDPDEFFFQDGQMISRELALRLLSSQKTAEELEALQVEDEDDQDYEEYVDLGLNPASDEEVTIGGVSVNHVTHLASILEQNFLSLDDEGEFVLEGISIGLALNPFQTVIDSNTGFSRTLEMSEQEIIAEGELIAQRLIEILRHEEGLESVPIMIGLYVLESTTSVVPGRLVSKTLVEENSENIDQWESVLEGHYQLPESSVSQYDTNISNEFVQFQNRIAENYPHHYSLVGIVQIIEGNVSNLEVTITTQILGPTEELALYQIVEDALAEISPEYRVTVTVGSNNDPVGVVQRPANGEVSIHRISW